jgi:hypothetical protein
MTKMSTGYKQTFIKLFETVQAAFMQRDEFPANEILGNPGTISRPRR